MRTSNPALRAKVFTDAAKDSYAEKMTAQGATVKTSILLFLCVLSAGWLWSHFILSKDLASITPWMIGGVIGGLVVAIITIFKPIWSPYTAPVYALLEGLVIGGLSAIFELQYPGIVVQAVMLTFGTLCILLTAFRMGWIQVTEKFRSGILIATGSIALVYLASFILSFFGIPLSFIHDNGIFGILWSVFVVIIASMNLLLDFDFIMQGERSGAPKYMEWYAAFGLLVTLIWLYIEILRLLSKLRRR